MTGRMRKRCGALVMLAMVVFVAGSLRAQSNGSAVGEHGSAGSALPAAGSAVAVSNAAGAAKASDATALPLSGGAQGPVVAPVLLPATEKRKALEVEADRLVAMATELKTRVDKTNKNILSLTVVEQAEEIEHYAHQLKAGEKK